MNRKCLLLAICAMLASPALAKDIYLSPAGSDAAAGTAEKPYKTLARAAEEAGPGDNILLLGGRYAEPMEVSGLRGRDGKPITIMPAPGAKVVFDGTDPLPDAWREVTPDSDLGAMIQEAQWARIGDRRLYSLKLDRPVYAMIYGEKLMSDARWPDSRWDDPWRMDRYNVLRRATEQSTPGEIYDGFPTDNTLEESSLWVHYDREARAPYRETLADTGLDFTGAVAVLSYAWGSFGTRVLGHEAGADHFRFDTGFAGSGSIREEAVRFVVNRIRWKEPQRFQRSSHGGIHFFFEGLPALDIEQEWWYDQDSGLLFFIAPDGGEPDAGKVRGKRRDYLVTIRDSRYVHLKGFDFFGAAVRLEETEHSRIEDSNFLFSSYHKFVVGNFDMPVTVRIANSYSGTDRLFGNALVNCQFSYVDGNAFEGRSTGLVIDNVLVWRTQQTTLGLDSRSISIDRPSVVRRVTLGDIGASVGIKGGAIDGLYELNKLCCFGGLQYDGAALQMGGREHFRYHYNWSHDHPKRSYRFDAGNYPAYSNAFGEIAYNLAWNTPGGMAIKGDDHLLHNNVMLGDTMIQLFNMERWASENRRTVVANNAVPRYDAGIDDRSGITPPPRAKVLSVMHNNVTGDAAPYLRDPSNLDFRPRKDSPLVDAGYRLTKKDVPWKETPFAGPEVVGEAPDIGAYEYGAKTYWIPGFKYAQASTPVPPDGAVTAMPDADLMWLGGYKADTHHVFFGRDRDAVAAAAVDSPEYRGTFEGEHNIFAPGELEPGGTYYWRVDAVRDGETMAGETWVFTVRR